MKPISVIDNLKIYEMERKTREKMAPQKKKTITFKSIPIISDEDDEEEDDEDLFLKVKNVRKIYNKANFNNRSVGMGKRTRGSFASIAGSRVTWLRIVRRPKANHLPPRSPTKRRLSKLRRTQRVNPMKRWTWQMCFMANDNTPKITS